MLDSTKEIQWRTTSRLVSWLLIGVSDSEMRNVRLVNKPLGLGLSGVEVECINNNLTYKKLKGRSYHLKSMSHIFTSPTALPTQAQLILKNYRSEKSSGEFFMYVFSRCLKNYFRERSPQECRAVKDRWSKIRWQHNLIYE